jgi:hypothetical protein
VAQEKEFDRIHKRNEHANGWVDEDAASPRFRRYTRCRRNNGRESSNASLPIVDMVRKGLLGLAAV